MAYAEAILRESSQASTEHDPGRKVVVLYNESGAALAAGDTVMLDTAGSTFGLGNSVKKGTATAADSVLYVGRAIEAIADDAWGKVQVSGIYVNAPVSAGVAAGEPLAMTTDAGKTDTATIGTHHVIEVALEAIAAGVADVRIVYSAVG